MTFKIWADSLHSSDLVNAQDLLEKPGADEHSLYEVEIRMQHKRGHYVWVLSSGKVVEWQKKR
jgi:hypothetical protein